MSDEHWQREIEQRAEEAAGEKPFERWPKDAQDHLLNDLSAVQQAAPRRAINTPEEIVEACEEAGKLDSHGMIVILPLDHSNLAIEQSLAQGFRGGFTKGWAKASVEAKSRFDAQVKLWQEYETLLLGEFRQELAMQFRSQRRSSILRRIWKWTATAVVIAAGAALIWALNQG